VKASIMITCLGDMFFPEVGVAMVTLLRRLGATVDFPQGQTCCGMPLFNSGYHHDAAIVAARTVGLFAEAEYVVVPSGSCAWMVKTEYPGLLKDDPALKAAAEALAKKTYELSQFLVDVLGVTSVESSFRGKVTYHDSCHLLRGLGESRAPRVLLRGVKGCELVELPGSDECCGFGGSYSIKYPEISQEVLKNKMENIKATGVQTVAVDCPGCKLQIEGGLEAAGTGITVEHSATLLARKLRQ